MATTTRERAIQEVRNRISCTEYLEKSKGGLYCCPYCGSGTGPHGTGAVKYYADTNTWACHACKESGDVIDLHRKATGTDFSTALTELCGKIGIALEDGNTSPLNAPQRQFNQQKAPGSAGTAPAEKTQQEATEAPTTGTADYTDYYKACRERLAGPAGSAARDYLTRRGVLSTAWVCGAGYDPEADPGSAPGAMGKEHKPHPCPRIIFPCSRGHYVARRIDGNTEYKALNPNKDKGAEAPAIFNGDTLHAQEVQEIFVTEGIFDALSIIEAGGQAVALNSAGNIGKLIQMLEQNPTAATVVLCPDNDPDESTRAKVKKHFDNLATGLDRLHIPFITADINNGCKDANEALQKNREAFTEGVKNTIAEARAYKENLQREAQQAEQDRRQRTGAGMVDAFLQAVQTERYKPVPTGITDIDKALTGGFTRQQLILLGAAPGAGKTALTQWIFEGMAKAGHTVLFLNLEMSREQILARSISRIAAQNGDHITPAEVKQGYNWNFAQRAIVTEAAEKYKREIAPHMIYNPDGVTADLDGILKYLEEEASRAEAAGLPAPLVVLDYLQIITGRDREDGTALIKRAVGSLKRFAIQHDTLVFCIIAHNRAANQSGTVTMESGRDTSALEYSADLQLGLAFTRCLYRPGQDRKEADALTPEERRFVTLKITKGRDARIGAEVDLCFDGETMTYQQLAPAYMEEPPQQVKPIRI